MDTPVRAATSLRDIPGSLLKISVASCRVTAAGRREPDGLCPAPRAARRVRPTHLPPLTHTHSLVATKGM